MNGSAWWRSACTTSSTPSCPNAGRLGLKAAASRERTDKAMRLRFGDDAYAQLAAMRLWLGEQANRAEMLAFLNTKAD
ncbi:hypothetical protein LP419_38410 [Massilia sp. H-1]|nr:hypothetical protein LP419_38410 [Massilia sp. H-1]